MPVGAVIGGIGAAASVAGGAIAASGAKDAAEAQERAAKEATALQREMFETTREDLMPYSDVGKNALYSLADLYGLPTPLNPEGGTPFGETQLEIFRRSPDYQVALKEGIAALDKSAASRGLLLSGGQIKALADYGADLGSKNFGNYVNRLLQLTDTGRLAASQTGQFASSAARGMADTTMAGGEAKAAGIVGSTNALGSGVSDAFNNLATMSMANYYNPSSYAAPNIGMY